ncbi:MAG: hypothetical protein NTX92_08870 [Euryarchaeota archaeon]|nr:hypothetical protein [Euryarchaeota archaeon]
MYIKDATRIQQGCSKDTNNPTSTLPNGYQKPTPHQTCPWRQNQTLFSPIQNMGGIICINGIKNQAHLSHIKHPKIISSL